LQSTGRRQPQSFPLRLPMPGVVIGKKIFAFNYELSSNTR